MLPGVAGEDDTLIFNWLGDELPHEPFATTESVPPVGPGTAVMLLVEEVPAQPLGKVQVYELAPETAAML